MKKLAKNKLSEVWQLIANYYELFLPVDNGGKLNFTLWQENAVVDLDRLKTALPPKGILFPPSETYLNFRTDGKKLLLEQAQTKQEEYVVFGVRPCDIASLALLDNVFLKEPVDRFYEERRKKGIIVSLACNEPEETCFCSSFGIDAASAPKQADVAAWDINDTIYWQPQTEKGWALTDKLFDFLVEVTAEEQAVLAEHQAAIREKMQELPLSDVDPTKITAEMKNIFEAKIWAELSASCLGCGACTFVCPTCHCYDIQDFDGGKGGERFRCWDSCMYSDFTRMAHGNPRTTQKERFRQRFMHKLVYYPKQYGPYACVGCGRCLEACPVNMNIVKVIRKIGGDSCEL